MDYKYDVFVSYRRSGHGQARQWVLNHFYPLLRGYLADQIERDPAVFIDRGIGIGEHWPVSLAEALRCSRVLVAVWSPPYFASAWCQAEWQSMLKREELCGLATADVPQGLIFPVVFADRQNFPARAQATQALDLTAWNWPDPIFASSALYLGLRREVERLATEIVALLPQVPPWRDWPVCLPDPVDMPPPALPRL